MKPQIRARGAAALLIVLLLLPSGLVAAPASAGPVKLVVVISVDGLSWSRLEGYEAWFEAAGGLKRLLIEGQVQTNTNYAHLNTETGPGHSSLGTGAPPRVHGIVANRWFEPNPDGTGGLINVYCTDQLVQPFYREVEKEGRIHVFARERQLAAWETSGEMGNQVSTYVGDGPNGETLIFDSDEAVAAYNNRQGLPLKPKAPTKIAGPGNLRVPTLGDRLVEESPRSRVVALSGKDRGAIFLAGRNPAHVVYWYDRDTGRFTSSAAYDATGDAGKPAADLVQQFNTRQAGWQLVARFGTVWSRLPEPQGVMELPRPERNIAKFQMPELGIGFDHDLIRHPGGYFNAIYGSPFQDQLLTDLALAFLNDAKLSLGQRGVPDLFALSYSAHDVVSHNFGNESEEELDALRRLDHELGRLLAKLEEIAKAEPAGQVVLALSADHGFARFPETVRRENGQRAGGRLQASDLLRNGNVNPESPFPNFVERLNRALAEELCLPLNAQPVFGVDGWTVAYDPRPLSTREDCSPAGQPVTFADLDRVFKQVVLRFFGSEIQDVLLISQRNQWPAGGEGVSFALNDFDAERSGNAFLIPRENVLMAFDPSRGSGHGSHYEYDTHVPLIFWGGPFRAGERSEAAAPYDLAPTLADLLGIRLPNATGTSHLPKR